MDNIDLAALFGIGLNYDVLTQVKGELSGLTNDVIRLNSFRMFSTDLDMRVKEYCARVAHIYPPCIGGCLPSYHQKIDLT